jgi:hypothetical protein
LGNVLSCPYLKNDERVCEQICKNVLYLIKAEFCITESHIRCPYYKILENPNALCPHIKDCNQNYFAFTLPFDKMLEAANTYCINPNNRENCERYKMYMSGEKPSEKLLPDGMIYKTL